MTYETKLMCGVTLITIPSIEYGGYFLLRVLSGKMKNLQFNDFQKSMFRAGHAHAGVLVILSLICQILTDHTELPVAIQWAVRVAIPLAALLVSGGFFFSSMHKDATAPNGWIKLLYLGVFMLGASLVTLGIGLL